MNTTTAPARKPAKHKRPKAQAAHAPRPPRTLAEEDGPESAEFKRGEAGEAHRDPSVTLHPDTEALMNADHPAQISSELAARSHLMGRQDRDESLDLSETPQYVKDREGGDPKAD